MKTPDDWVETDRYGYSPKCWDPDEYHTKCLECGAALIIEGDRSGTIAACSKHGVVYIL